MEFKSSVKLEKLMKAKNIVPLLDEDDVKMIGRDVVQTFEADLASRVEWEDRVKLAMKLTLTMAGDKNVPFTGASNAKFPLVSMAVTQFHSRAYPTLVPGPMIARKVVYGPDKTGTRQEQADRVGAHMSHQILEEDPTWADDMDRTLHVTALVGCAFKKVYFDSLMGVNKAVYVSAADFVVDYWTKSLHNVRRQTHRYWLTPNSCREKEVRGLFVEVDRQRHFLYKTDNLSSAEESASGVSQAYAPGDDAMVEILEQHRWMDLDDDGYEEPYIVYVERDTAIVRRVVANFIEDSIKYTSEGAIFDIKPEAYFVKYGFIPSPDGGFYDLGWGQMLGPTNDVVNTLINLMIDAGKFSTLGGGFLANGVRVRGGNYAFKPGEWKRTECAPEELRNGVMPLPIREPSAVLQAMVSLFLTYGERLGSATETLTGVAPGQNTPATTTQTTVEQGLKVFGGIMERLYRSLQDELRKWYRLNQLYLASNSNMTKHGNPFGVTPKDYEEPAICIKPFADADMAPESLKVQKALLLVQRAQTEQGYDKDQVERNLHTALGFQDTSRLYPGPQQGQGQAPQDPRAAAEAQKMQLKMAELKQKDMHFQAEMKMKQLELMSKMEKEQAEILNLQAQAVSKLADAKGVETGHQIALIEAQIGAKKAKLEHLADVLGHLTRLSRSSHEGESGNMGRVENERGGSGGEKASGGSDSGGGEGASAGGNSIPQSE